MGSPGYKGLAVYREAHRLAVEVHRMSLRLPRFEMYEEGSQVRRSSKGIAANIVEGYGRRAYKADYLRFPIYAHASCGETREHLEFLRDCGSLDDMASAPLLHAYEALGRNLFRFTESVARIHVTPSEYRGHSGESALREALGPGEGLDPDLETWLEEQRQEYAKADGAES